MGRSRPTESDVEWLDGGEPPRHASEDHVARSRSWLTIGVLAAMALVASTLILVGGMETSPAEDPAESSEAELRRANSLRDLTLDLGQARSAAVNALEGPIVDDLRGLARLDLALRAVLTTADGTEARLVSVSADGDVLVAPLPQSSEFSFDASGQWLAGISLTSQGQQRQVLWAGRVGSEPEPVAVGIDGYAWHETAPGLVAWSEEDTRKVTTLALDDQTASLLDIELPIAGRVEAWGDWGFALLTPGTGLTTAVFDADAEILGAGLPGRFSGHLPGGELLLTGGVGDPVAFNPASGNERSISWLDGRDYVWASSVSQTRPEAVVLVGRDGVRADPFRGEITLVDGAESAEILAETDAFTDVAWTPDQEFVVFADQQTADRGLPGRIRVIGHDGRVDAVLVPDLFSGREWVAALSVR